MEVRETRDRVEIEAFLRRDAATHVYALADLDEFFWRDTKWYVGCEDGEIRALCLVLDTLDPPILYAIDPAGVGPLRELLDELRASLPRSFFATFSPGLEDWFRAHGSFLSHGVHDKMILSNRKRAEKVSPEGVERLTSDDLGELQRFLGQRAYLADERAARFFEPYMLETGPYFGMREAGELVSVGGVHVHSNERSVAALGNLATSFAHRRRGHGRAVSAAICRELAGVEDVGLNVVQTNRAAIRCYLGLGFRRLCSYMEATVTG